jgi:hypothetical protein
MKIKINNNGEYIPATLEVVDGAMIVSPKEGKVDIAQFKDGDIITCGWHGKKKSYSWTCVLRGDIEPIADNMFIADYCSVDSNGAYTCENGGSDSAKWVRYATEGEKQELFDALAKQGKIWDAEKKAVVELKWKPKIGDDYYAPLYTNNKVFSPCGYSWYNSLFDTNLQNRGWVFRTNEECEAYCERLNQAIMEVKP